ncbi:transposase [Jannaschia sp.]|nr:transposase [Jannaschia sp.]
MSGPRKCLYSLKLRIGEWNFSHALWRIVAQGVEGPDFPFPQSELDQRLRNRDAKDREAIWDGDAGLELGGPAIEFAGRAPPTDQRHAGHPLAIGALRPPYSERLRRWSSFLRRQKGLSSRLIVRMLVSQSLPYWLGLKAPEKMVRDRWSWMRFCGLGIADTVPDADTLWGFREALMRADGLDALFAEMDMAIHWPTGHCVAMSR